ncbi:MAG: hypothetical protein OSJ68_10180 [Clostridia bacterium]|jgi:hypothetical protein|nr:hypothetical protein [Clostridia bacterium]
MNKSTAKQRETYTNVEDYEENCYLFSPSIQRQRTIGGKSYYVRRYFRGGTDFEKTMEKIAVKNATKKAR